MRLNREDYLLVIWEHLESFDKISAKQIANRLKISSPTAHEYLVKLSDEGLINKRGKDISFTLNGKRVTRELVRMHRISEVFAYKFLEVPWEDTHASVMELEHLFNNKQGEVLFKNLGRPDSCPHGNPTDPDMKIRETPLLLAEEGNYVIRRVVFEDDKLLKRLASINALPDASVRVYRGEDLEIETDHGSLKIPHKVSMSLRLTK